MGDVLTAADSLRCHLLFESTGPCKDDRWIAQEESDPGGCGQLASVADGPGLEADGGVLSVERHEEAP